MNIKKFNIVAINADIVYNKYGDHDPNGKMYVLKQYEKKVKQEIKENSNKTTNLVQPLVIRVNVGDLVEIKFKNKTKNLASIHIQEDGYDVKNVGFNKKTMVRKGRSKKYKWYAKREGTFFFYDIIGASNNNLEQLLLSHQELHGLIQKQEKD